MYKKISLYLISIILTITLANSQTYVGLTAGTNYSTLSGSDFGYSQKVRKVGLNGGITFDIKIQQINKAKFFRKTTLQTGLIYSQQGVIYKNSYFGKPDTTISNVGTVKITEKYKRRVNYLTIPLVWKQDWGSFYTRLGVYGQIGLRNDSITKMIYEQPTKVIRDTVNYKAGMFEEHYKEMPFSKDFMTGIFGDKAKADTLNIPFFYDIGLNIGFGYQIPIKREYDFFIDFSFHVGLKPIDVAYRPEEIMRNSYFSISTGIIFYGKKGKTVRYR